MIDIVQQIGGTIERCDPPNSFAATAPRSHPHPDTLPARVKRPAR